MLIAIGIVLSYLIARYASKPLREISASAAQIGQGNLDVQVPMRGARETVDLGRSLTNMRDDLKALYNDLETMVESRTSDLAEASERLMVEVADRKAAEVSLSHRNQELEILLNLARILGRAGDYEEKRQEVLEDLARITQADMVTLRVLDEEKQTLRLVASAGEVTSKRPLNIKGDDKVAAEVFRLKSPWVASNYPATPWADPESVAQGVRSAVVLPVIAGESLDLGVVSLGSLRSSHFDEQAVRMLTAVADWLGVLLESASLAQDLEASREKMAAVDQVARIITSTLDIDQVYQRFAAEVNTLIDFRVSTLNTIDEKQGKVTISYLNGQISDLFQQGAVYRLEGTYAGHVTRTLQTLIVSGLTQETRFWMAPHNVRDGLRSVIVVPLVSQNKLIGSMLLFSERSDAYGSREKVILERLASQIAPAVENARLFQDVEQLALALESIGDAVMLVDSQGNFRFVNNTFEQTFGYTAEEVLGRPVGMISVAGPEGETYGDDEPVETFREGWRGEVRRIKKNGELLDMDMTVTPVRSQQGDVLGDVVVAHDITERKRAEEALREAEERYRLIFENASDAIITFTLDSKIISMNPEAEKMTGYSEEELVGQRGTVYLTPASAQLMQETMARWLAGEFGPRTIECEGIRKDGVIVPFEGRTQFIRNEEGKPVGYQGIFRDITHRKRAEEERRALEMRALAQSKLATLGQLATGVAHEINQPLTYISSMIQSFQEDIRLDDLDLQNGQIRLAESGRQVSRITNIVDHLRTFGRREDTEMTAVSLDEVLDSTLLLLGERLRLRNIELERRSDDNLPTVWGNSSQLEQVYINLFQNSIDALAETRQGKITVAVHLAQGQGQVVLEFSDNGVGIRPTRVEKVFDPFFTTKPEGEGTGLGLSIVYGIIMDHHGTIACESNLAQGTTIKINPPAMVLAPGLGETGTWLT